MVLSFLVLTPFYGACGGKVVVDQSPGGAGGESPTSSNSSSSSSSSSSASSSSGTTSSGGLVPLCYLGFSDACQPCAQEAIMGGICEAAYQGCVQSEGACGEFGSCSGGCGGEQACCDKCDVAFPTGSALYGAVVACVACNACPAECGDAVQPGFCP